MTPAPFIAMLRVDAARMGGLHGGHRHAFGMAAADPPEPRTRWAPPPKRRLAEGPVRQPELSQAQVADIQADLDAIAETLELELEAVKVEADAVSGPALRVEPELYRSIAVIGPVFTPQQVRSALLVDSREIESAANRLLTGSAFPYLSDSARSKLQTVVSDAKALVNYVQQFDLEPLTGDAARLAQDHVDSHVKAAKEMTAAVERKVVGAEAPSVPVEERLGTGSAWGAIIAAGALVVVGLLISELA